MTPLSIASRLAATALVTTLTLAPLPAMGLETDPLPSMSPSITVEELAPITSPSQESESKRSPSSMDGLTNRIPSNDVVQEDTEPISAENALQGLGNARMGQGLERLEITGDAQIAIPFEPGGSASIQSERSAAAAWRPAGIQGMDVSSHQSNVDWTNARRLGSEFAYVKATEGTGYVNPFYPQQYNGSASVGMLRGAYHFAIPTPTSSGAAQASYFVRNGGGWSADGKTLPPLLDIEYNPYPSLGNSCYNMSATQMVSWIRDFSSTMKSLTGRIPMIYTTTDWWVTCTGNSSAFADHPLHIASYSQATPKWLPNGWSSYSVWQYSDAGPFVGDSNVWRGTTAELAAFASNSVLGSVASVAKPGVDAAAARTPAIGAPTSALVCGISDGGCYQNFQNGQVHWTKSTGAYATQGAVNAAWGRSGWEKGSLGFPVGDLSCGLKESGCYQNFQKGKIYWSPSTGAQTILGAIDGAWSSLSRERGQLGYPTSTQICGLVAGGCYQNFQNGQIHWSQASGAFATWGAFSQAWGRTGWEKSALGYPTSNETCGLPGGGCYQNFQNGQIHRSATTGANFTTGPIAQAWAANGWERGKLGYPTSNPVCGLINQGCVQTFQKGNVYTSPRTGTAMTSGAIDTVWSALGRERGKLGYPTSNEICGLPGDGCYQNYQGGQIHWSPATGANATYGSIASAWAGSGWERGVLGYPIGGEVCGLPGGGCYQNFQKGQIHWSPATGANATRGVFNTAWAQTRWEAGKLGYPTANQTCGLPGGGCYQDFQKGQIHWSPATGAHPTTGAIATAWAGTGWERGSLGYPTTNETCTTTGTCTQKFQKGQLTWSPTRGITRR